MPVKRKGESRGSYVSRFMKSDYSKDKPTKRRLAIAYSEYGRQKRKKRKRS